MRNENYSGRNGNRKPEKSEDDGLITLVEHKVKYTFMSDPDGLSELKVEKEND